MWTSKSSQGDIPLFHPEQDETVTFMEVQKMKRKLLSVLLVLVLALGLLPTTAFADGNSITIANTPITAGKYYVSKTGGGIESTTGTPTSGYVYYNSTTGVLTLNNVSIEASGGAYGIASSDSGTLTIDLTGSNSITVTGEAGGMYIGSTDCTITGTGSLTVTCEKMSALQVKSLTVDSAVTLSFTTNGESGDCVAIDATGDISLNKAAVTAKADKNPAISSKGAITISGGSVTASCMNYENPAIDSNGNNGAITISGGTVRAFSAGGVGLYTNGNLNITGGTVAVGGSSSVFAYADSGLTVDGDVVVYARELVDYCQTTLTEGVVYTGTTVSIDADGNTVLSGGVGTVYGNPNVTGFTVPNDSTKLGTALNDVIVIVPNVQSGGSPEPVVQVKKTVLNKTLLEDMDYTVDLTVVDLTIPGEKTAKIKAVAGSGNTGSKEFGFEVVAATNDDDENNDDANGGGNEATGGEHHRVNRQNTTTATTDTAKTDTTKADTVTSAKTFDAGTAVYGLLAVTSLLGMGYVGKKR